MAIAAGVNKELRYKVESTFNTAPSAGSAQLLRRVSSTLALKKQTYESNELATHRQRQDFRHGHRSVEGAIAGELSAGTWEDLIAAALRKAYAEVTAIASLSITITGSGPTYTAARGSGSWLSDGVKAGQVGRFTAGSMNAANLNKNLFVLAATASNLTLMPLNGVAMAAEGPTASCTWTTPGKESYVPATGHTDLSYAFEHYHADLTLSELFLGCKISQMDIALPPTGLATIGLNLMGASLTTAGAEYFTTPTAETTTGALAAVNGLLVAQGGAITNVTGLNFSLKGNMNAEPVVGSDVYSDITEGRVLVDGSLTAHFTSATLRDYFLNETEVALLVALCASPSATADFMAFSLPRIKFGGADLDDGDKALVRTLPFTALYNSAGGSGTSSHKTTLAVQDSQA